MAWSHGLEPEAVHAWVAACGALALLAAAPFAAKDTALEEERTCVHGALRAARPILAYRLQHRLHEADAHARLPSCAKCDKTAPPHARRIRSWESVTGPLALERRYFYCALCELGTCPAERVVGLPSTAFTAFYEDRCTRMATLLPHRKAVAEVAECFGIEPGVTTVEAMVARRAVAVQTIQHAEATTLAPYDKTGLPREMPPLEPPSASSSSPPPPPPPPPDVVYVELDGVIPMTRELIEPTPFTTSANDGTTSANDGTTATSANDGTTATSANDDTTTSSTCATREPGRRGGAGRKYELVGREVKNGVLYDGAHCAEESASRGCITEKRYVSHLGDWKVFATLLWVQIVRLRFHRARQLVVLSDGAEWVRSLAAWLPISVLLILDLFHAKHRVWEVANALYGERTAEAQKWAHSQNDRVEQGRAQEVIEALALLPRGTDTTRKLIDALKTYLTNNLDRMDYPRYRSLGLRVTTAAVESGNYHMTGVRLKGQGMRWAERGAGDMATLRADLSNGDWNRRTREILDAAA